MLLNLDWITRAWDLKVAKHGGELNHAAKGDN